MPTLSKTKKEASIVAKWGGISLLIIILIFGLIKFVGFVVGLFSPPPTPKASFGKLPEISFPNQQASDISYSIDTISGFLPSFPTQAEVHEIFTAKPTLLALDKTEEKAAKVGFTSQKTQIADDVYQWTNTGLSFPRRITINIFTSDFTIASPYLAETSMKNFTDLDQEQSAVDLAKSFLKNMSSFPQDLDEEKTKTTLYAISQGQLIPTTSISSAKIIKVDFFQKDLNNLPIFYEAGGSSTMYLLIGNYNGRLEVVNGHYFYKNISQDSSTYALKSINEAFEELKNGEGYIAFNPQNLKKVSIKDVVLGYYIGEGDQNFLMPIAIFEGNDDFIGYVSMIKDEWIGN